MPLIKCPECGKKVSTNAQTCPHCGNPLNVNGSGFKTKNEPKNFDWIMEYKTKRRKTKRNVLIVGLIFIGVAIGFIVGYENIDILDRTFSSILLLIFGIIFIAIGITLPIAGLIGIKIDTRTIDGYNILVYSGFFKNIVVVDGDVNCVGGPFKSSLYVDLPNGRRVLVLISLWDGSITITTEN